MKEAFAMNCFKVFKAFMAALCAAAVFVPAAFAGEYFPVIVDGELIGAFDNEGEWHGAPETVTVGGRTVALSEPASDEGLMRRLEDGERVPCETPLIGAGRRLSYWSPSGREGEASVERVSLYYEGEASGMSAI